MVWGVVRLEGLKGWTGLSGLAAWRGVSVCQDVVRSSALFVAGYLDFSWHCSGSDFENLGRQGLWI